MPTSSIVHMLFLATVGALHMPLAGHSLPCRSPGVRMEFGDSFYQGFEKWAAEYPEEDRINFPEYFVLPKGVYEVSLQKPLGIAFEEIEVGKGVKVVDLVEGSNAARSGLIDQEHVLLAVTAIKVIGAKYERKLLPARTLNLDTVIDAIGSNAPRWGCDGAILQFATPEADPAEVAAYLKRIELPADSPWRG